MEDRLRMIASAALAGICITLGCVVNLKVGGPLGAFMFSFGLLAVILWKFPLYTGAMGFTTTRREFGNLWLILLGNIIGCAMAGISISYATPEIAAGAETIIAKHLGFSWAGALILSIWCGLIMTVVVRCGRMQPRRYLGIVVLGIALFILSGYIHSIADAGYIFICSSSFLGENIASLLPFYLLIVVGNYIGGNLVRLLQWTLKYED